MPDSAANAQRLRSFALKHSSDHPPSSPPSPRTPFSPLFLPLCADTQKKIQKLWLLGEPSANTPYPLARTFAPPPPHPTLCRKIFVAGSLRCRKLSARSRRSGLRSRAEDNKPSLAYHASANTVGCVHSASFACNPSRPHSRHAGPCGCYAVRASRSANPTPSARVHLPPLHSHLAPTASQPSP